MQFLDELDQFQQETERSTNMINIKMRKEEILSALRVNLTNQKLKQAAAEAKWREQFAQRLEETLAAIKQGNSIPLDVKQIVADLERPANVIQVYTDVIEMLEAHMDDYFELSGEQFKMWIKDRWDWRERWTVSNSKYLG